MNAYQRFVLVAVSTLALAAGAIGCSAGDDSTSTNDGTDEELKKAKVFTESDEGKTVTVTAASTDYAELATALGRAVTASLGVERPQTLPASSRDLSPALRGESLPGDAFPRELFGQYDLVNSGGGRQMRMLRTERWKLTLHLNAPEQHELYDLAADPGERTNLFGQPGTESVVNDLKTRLRERMAAINDPRRDEIP